MLEVDGLHAFYGKSHVLQGVSFKVGKGEIVSLLGRNGVGRSTTVKAIMGLVAARGMVRFKGEDILGLKANEIACRGLGYVPEDRAIFPELTVRQNLELGMKQRQASGRWKVSPSARALSILVSGKRGRRVSSSIFWRRRRACISTRPSRASATRAFANGSSIW